MLELILILLVALVLTLAVAGLTMLLNWFVWDRNKDADN